MKWQSPNVIRESTRSYVPALTRTGFMRKHVCSLWRLTLYNSNSITVWLYAASLDETMLSTTVKFSSWMETPSAHSSCLMWNALREAMNMIAEKYMTLYFIYTWMNNIHPLGHKDRLPCRLSMCEGCCHSPFASWGTFVCSEWLTHWPTRSRWEWGIAWYQTPASSVTHPPAPEKHIISTV